MSKIITAAFLVASVFVLSACNTMEGAGKDIQKGGEKLENAADKNK
ncbi:MAG TPA: entericidin A/B family lipoprotein [Methylophilaceae bacterium]|nr:entericidin A/B family lipoprotein [Methylotenera sp.]HSH73378.1 entericidin A/B family lipoprotein [Methylophilaceae bacterium]